MKCVGMGNAKKCIYNLDYVYVRGLVSHAKSNCVVIFQFLATCIFNKSSDMPSSRVVVVVVVCMMYLCNM